MSEEQRRLRGWVVIAVLTLVFGLLLLRLVYLQVIEGERFSVYAQQQRVRIVELTPPRGEILDRRGRRLATSRSAYAASLVYTGKPLPADARRRLKRVVGVSDAAIDEALAQLRRFPFRRARLQVDLSPSQQTLLEESRHRLPGVIVEALPLRTYPYGPLAAHVLGYLRQLGEWTLQGAYGLEGSFEGPLQRGGEELLGLAGSSGKRLVEVDASGRPVSVLESREPRPGNTLVLTLDASLQAAVERALDEQMQALREDSRSPCPCPASAAAAAVIEVGSGRLLAMASRPAYDPNLFALQPLLRQGTGRRELVDERIRRYARSEERVFWNRAIRGRYPPGSVFKVVTALAGGLHGLGGQQINCRGAFSYGGRVYHDWRAHGATDMVKAIGRSCNVYFWTMGLKLGTDRMGQVAATLGLDGTTGLRDLEGELPGRFPFRGDPLNAAIGQGEHLYTPLQVASLMATVANGGRRFRPYLVERVRTPAGDVVYRAEPEVLDSVDLPPGVLGRVVAGMRGATTCPRSWCGTAYGSFWDAPYTVAGKTGTVQRTGFEEAENYAWFASFGPAGPEGEPRIAVAVLIEGGGGGSRAAAPVARRIYDAYLGHRSTPLGAREDLPAGGRSSQRGGSRTREGE